MSRKDKRGKAPGAGRLDPSGDPYGLSVDRFGALLLALCLVAAAFVSFWFERSLPRSFDVPKALALKLGGGGALALWLGYALLGKPVKTRSLSLFGAPVFAFCAVAAISSLLSLDLPTSLNGVYERQFGLQGIIACAGLFVGVAAGLKGKRGALAVLGALAFLGGVLGSYAVLQSYGLDPFGFFKKPNTKVFSFTGNATFAGNALALVFPVSSMLAVVASVAGLRPAGGLDPKRIGPWALGALGGLGLLMLPGGLTHAASAYQVGIIALVGALIYAGDKAYPRAEAHAGWARPLLGGLLSALAISIGLGLVYTRTRGAWVGTGVAIGLGLLLLPRLFLDKQAEDGRKLYRRLQGGAVGLVLAAGLLFLLFVTQAESICSPGSRCQIAANTIRSIPAAFHAGRKDFGTGQGTRRYLWLESPRVLTEHGATLDRKYRDQDFMAAKLKPKLMAEIGLKMPTAPDPSGRGWDRSWRKLKVWLFGIGVETYRYAFMSHKSERLESLDPMTNHDNPHNNYLYVLASFGILGLGAYLWLLGRLLLSAYRHFDPPAGAEPIARSERAIAFGVVTSFFSYAVYSIAGFDSVVCSVFFYILLGATAALIRPNEAEAEGGPWIPALWARLSRGRPLSPGWARGLAIGIGLIGFLAAAETIYGGIRSELADAALGDSYGRAPPGENTFNYQRRRLLSAIRSAPSEPMYKQKLGDLYLRRSRAYRRVAREALQRQELPRAQALVKRARADQSRALEAYIASLEHAWAPENAFLKMYQVHHEAQDLRSAEVALGRALEHSPYLAQLHAYRAQLQAELGEAEAAHGSCAQAVHTQPNDRAVRRLCRPILGR